MEIVLSILEAAYFDASLEPDVELLKNSSLVCRGWSTPSQKLLFRHVFLRTQTAFIAFQSAVDRSTLRGRMLGDAVTRLRVTLDHNQPYRLSHRSFARAMLLCPNLYELDLALYGQCAPGQDVTGAPDAIRMARPAPSFDDGTLSLLRSGPRITALQFSNWSDNSQSASQLLDVWPSLKSVVLKGLPPSSPSASASSLPFRCALHELRMNFQASPSLDFVQWLLHNSATTLRILELEREPSADLLDLLVRDHGATLESLSLPACGSHDHALAVQQCERLKEFKIESPWVPPMVFKKLPATLEHLAFGVDKDTPLHMIVEAVKAKAGLKAVSVHLWEGGEDHAVLPSLRLACAYKGIELTTTLNVQRFRAMTVSSLV